MVWSVGPREHLFQATGVIAQKLKTAIAFSLRESKLLDKSPGANTY